jgi:hypothetical protein
MGRVLAKTIAYYDEKQGLSVTYLAGEEVPAEVAATITNPKVWADRVEDTADDDAAAQARAREAYKAGRPLRVLDDEEREAWAYQPDSSAGRAAEAKLVQAETGQGGAPVPADDFPTYTDKPRPDGWEDFTDAQKREYIYAPAASDDDDDDADGDPAGDDVIDFSDEPPREGRGSGVTAWRTYAEGKGLTVPAEADVDDIRALVDARKASQAAQ